MTAVLIRHTRVHHSVHGCCYGRRDVPLAETFDADAADVRARLPWAPAAIWSSPAERCRRLAGTLADGVTVRIDARLCELDFGGWEGRPWETFRGPASDDWAVDPWRRRPPGGESGDELCRRVAAIRAAVLDTPIPKLAIVTHAGVIRVWRALDTGRAFADIWSDPIECGSIHTVK